MKYRIYFLTLFLLAMGSNLSGQYKPVVETPWQSELIQSDTSNFYITRIDTLIFKKMLNQYKKVAIQFWQPWCRGEETIIPHLKEFKKKLEQDNYHLILLSDHQESMDYFKMANGKIGMIVSYFNKYHIDFQTYIIGNGENIATYQNLVSNFIDKPIKKGFSIVLLSDKKKVSAGYSYKIYKKYLKK